MVFLTFPIPALEIGESRKANEYEFVKTATCNLKKLKRH